MRNSKWDQYFLKMVDLVADKSKDRSTKCGAVIVGPDMEVLSTGYNGFPRGVNDDIESRHERPAKYTYTEHAERNAIFNAARSGIALKGTTMYIAWSGAPCAECSRAVIQAGIAHVVAPKDKKFAGKGSQWDYSLSQGMEMLLEAGVTFEEV